MEYASVQSGPFAIAQRSQFKWTWRPPVPILYNGIKYQ